MYPKSDKYINIIALAYNIKESNFTSKYTKKLNKDNKFHFKLHL